MNPDFLYRLGNFQKTFKVVLRNVAFGIPIFVTFIDMVGYVAKVEGISMQPCLNPDYRITDYVLLNRWAIRHFRFARGDVVSLFSPKDPDQKIIKRIIGLEGDTVRTLGYKDKFVRVPEGHCWVEGDHHGHSMDSNSFGPVAMGMVNAKASYIVWPPQRWQRMENHLPESRRPINLTDTQFDLLFPDFFYPSL